RDYLAWSYAACGHEMCDAVGEDTGLARACTSHDQERTAAVRDGVALGTVQTFEKLLLRGHGPQATGARGQTGTVHQVKGGTQTSKVSARSGFEHGSRRGERSKTHTD